MSEIHKLPGMQHEQNSTIQHHYRAVNVALISAFISFRLLVNMVFRDSGRSLSACCLPDLSMAAVLQLLFRTMR
jgi:hypothetical protein